jgi:outer membrane protein assembly factor BamB
MGGRLLALVCALAIGLAFAGHARAETISGTFTFADTDPTGTFPTVQRPIAGARVEIWTCVPGFLGACTWGFDTPTKTNGAGSITTALIRPPGTLYALRVFATNDAAVVWRHSVPTYPSVPFYAQPGVPSGSEIVLSASTPSSVLNFSFNWTDALTSEHFNIADAISLGRAYADAHRDPLESDVIPKVNVQPTTRPGTSFYDYPIDTLDIVSGNVFDDVVLLHEYSHFLEEQISHFAAIPAIHNGCTAFSVADPLGVFGAINSAQHAWMEGFADYLASVIDTINPPARVLGGGIGSVGSLEAFATCATARASFGGDAIELAVAGVLSDLFDGFNSAEPTDTLSARDTAVFHIFDRELDVWFQPTIEDFRDAWLGRKLPAFAMGSLYVLNGVPFRRPHPPIADAGADFEVTEGQVGVTLNGSASEDPETGTLGFGWTQISGPPVTLSAPNTALPTFAAPLVGASGATLVFKLTVTDPTFSGASDFVAVTIKDLPAYASLAPSPLDFGARKYAVKVMKQATLTNLGPGTLDVQSVQVTGSATFGYYGGCPSTLAANASCTLDVGFTPPASGVVTGTLRVLTPNSPNASVQIQLRGEGATPSAALDTTALNFGPVNMGATTTQTVRLSNTGLVPVTILSLSNPGAAGFAHTSCPTTISAGSSCLVTVTFSPTTAGWRGGWLRFDDDGGGPHDVWLEGTGVPIGNGAAYPTSLAFGSVAVGSKSGVFNATVTNIGGAPLNVYGASVTGPHWNDFHITSNGCSNGTVLQPASSGCTVGVVFAPRATGGRSAKLSVATSNGAVDVTLAGTGTASPVQTAWPSFGLASEHGGWNREETGIDTQSAAGLHVAWTAPTKDVVASSPAVADGIAVFGADDGGVYAVDAATGRALWNFATGDAVRSSPAIEKGLVVVGSNDDSVYALDLQSGNLAWSFQTKGDVVSSPAIADGLVFVGSTDGSVYALDLGGGGVVWSDAFGAPVVSSPAVAGHVVYVGATNNQLRAYEAAKGARLWTEFAAGPIRSSPAVALGKVFVGSAGGRLTAFDATTGQQAWSYVASGAVSSSPAVADGFVYFESEAGDTAALDAATGSILWVVPGGDGSSPAVANGIVYATSGGDLRALDAWSGTELVSLGLKIQGSSPAVANGLVYIGTATGLVALAP